MNFYLLRRRRDRGDVAAYTEESRGIFILLCCGSMTQDYRRVISGVPSCCLEVCRRHVWVLPVIYHPARYSSSDESPDLGLLGFYD